jgi:hypothetical protein
MKYIIHQKALYSDASTGLILAFSNSKEKAFKYVRENYPDYKRDSSQGSRDEWFFVSTIWRIYNTYEGSTTGQETLVWEYNWATAERGELIGQAGSVEHHANICRCLIATGEMLDEDREDHQRFLK